MFPLCLRLLPLLLLASSQQVGDYRPDSCPRLVCGDLNANHNVMTPDLPWVCAKGQDPTKIIVDACPDGLYCEAPEKLYLTWDPRQYFGFEIRCNKTMPKNLYAIYTDANATTAYLNTVCSGDVSCNSRLAVGTHPKQCQSDNDCLQLNGGTAPCLCGSDGNRYCSLSDGDYLLSDRHTAACSGYFARFLYWDLFKTYYPFLQNSPHCLGKVFNNIGLMDRLTMGESFEKTRLEVLALQSSMAVGLVVVGLAGVLTLA